MRKTTYLAAAVIVAVFTLALTSIPKVDATKVTGENSNKKWEYCTITLVNGGPLKAGKYTGSLSIDYARGDGIKSEKVELTADHDPSRLDNLESQLVGKALAKLGNDGWEMVNQGNVLNASGGDRRVIYFKRLVQIER